MASVPMPVVWLRDVWPPGAERDVEFANFVGDNGCGADVRPLFVEKFSSGFTAERPRVLL